MKKLNVLVLGVGGNVSQGILKALAASNLDYRVTGACIDTEALGLYLCDAAYISPSASEGIFISWLIDVCRNERVDIILTGVEEIIDRLVWEAEAIRKETDTLFVSSGALQLQVGRDKLKTCEWLKRNGCAFPMFAASENQNGIDNLIQSCGFPLIAKPRVGKGSQGVSLINDITELETIKGADNYVVQQYIGDEESEYTVACYCNKDGNFVELIIMKRKLSYGTTVKAEVVQNEAIRKEALKICEALRPIGPINLQMRLNGDAVPVCFEMNIRFSGTAPMRARFGFNDVEALIREHIFNEDISNFFNVTSGCAYRYWNEIYIDEKDMKSLHEDRVVSEINRLSNYVDGHRGKAYKRS